jgi:GTP-binding protein Era
VSDGAFRAGTIAVIGRPNVGKSTLLNRLIGEKLCITSAKPQTTRHAVRGVLTRADCQYVFVDTPGYQTRYRTALNRAMNRSVSKALAQVDLVFLVIEASTFGRADREAAKLLPAGVPAVLVINKIDRLGRREELLPLLHALSGESAFSEVVPVSAEKADNLETLLRVTRSHLPVGEALYPPDELTDRDERFLAAELLREKLFRRLGDELPYGLTVDIERFAEEADGMRRIFAVVIVDRPGHKAIVIGRGGGVLKRVATDARLDMERLFGSHVFLQVWVKVRAGWSDDERALRMLGYD